MNPKRPSSPDATLYQQIFEVSRDSIFLIDLESRYVEANPAAISLVGYSLDELRQMTVDDLLMPGQALPPEERQQSWREGHTVEVILLHKDGHPVPVELSITPVNLPDGQHFVLGMARDITERVQTERALKESEEKFAKAFQLAPFLMSLTRLADGHFIEANQNFLNCIGFTQEEVIGHTSADINLFTDPEDRTRLVSQLQKQGFVERMQTRINTRRGEIRDMLISARPLHIQETASILIVGMDITNRVQAKQALQHSSERLEILHTIDRAILAAESPQAIAQAALAGLQRLIPCPRLSVALIDQEAGEGRLLAASRDGEAQTFSGQPVPLADFDSFADLAQDQLRLIPNLEKVPVKSPEQERQLEDGMQATLNLPLLVEGELVGSLNLKAAEPGWFNDEHIEFAQDVATQLGVALLQARLREQLRRYGDELEQRVAERTHALEQRTAEIEKLNSGMLAMLEDLKEANLRYEQASRELQAANAELKAFTYSVSHDLKAPLRGIDGYSRLLLDDYYDQLDEDGRFFLENIRQAAGQMNQLIEDLLTYSRVERRALAPQPLSLKQLVEGLLLERRVDIQEHGTQIVLDLPCDEITADREGLTAALRNLLDNALKFSTAAHPPEVEIGSRLGESGCLIWIKDNGIGFDMTYRERIFEIFQRLHPPDAYPGTGIGLAIVQKAMQRMGGRTWAESEPGQGATFYLEVPHANA